MILYSAKKVNINESPLIVEKALNNLRNRLHSFYHLKDKEPYLLSTPMEKAPSFDDLLKRLDGLEKLFNKATKRGRPKKEALEPSDAEELELPLNSVIEEYSKKHNIDKELISYFSERINNLRRYCFDKEKRAVAVRFYTKLEKEPLIRMVFISLLFEVEERCSEALAGSDYAKKSVRT